MCVFEFARLAKDTPGIDLKFTIFLAKAYIYKEIGDYGVGLDAGGSLDAAHDATVMAEQFIECVTTSLKSFINTSSFFHVRSSRV